MTDWEGGRKGATEGECAYGYIGGCLKERKKQQDTPSPTITGSYWLSAVFWQILGHRKSGNDWLKEQLRGTLSKILSF